MSCSGATTYYETVVIRNGQIILKQKYEGRFNSEKTEGRIGYLHIPNMMDAGLVEFGRTWYPQTGKQAIIIDERYNGGGFVGDMIIDRLERELWSMTIPREGQAGRIPERDFHGPLVILINEDTGSNGEFFAEAIKRKNLATVMGVRTWGGSIGIEPHQGLVDGATTTPPQFGLYALDESGGKWSIPPMPSYQDKSKPGMSKNDQ